MSKRKKINREMAFAELARCFGEDRAAVVARGLMSEVWVVIAHNMETGEDGVTVYLTELAALVRIFGDFLHDDIRDLLEWNNEPAVTVEQAIAIAARRDLGEMHSEIARWNESIWELSDRGWTYSVDSYPVLLEGESGGGPNEPANEPE